MTQNILYETPAPHVARIVMNRPQARNAQDTRLLDGGAGGFRRLGAWPPR